MREIEFRGVVLYNGNHRFCGEVVYGYYYEKMGKHFIIENTEDEHYNISYDHVEVDPKTVGQYIGMKDKDKIKIYEGDYVTGNNSRTQQIEFRNGAFRPKYCTHLRGIQKMKVIKVDYCQCGNELTDEDYDNYGICGECR